MKILVCVHTEATWPVCTKATTPNLRRQTQAGRWHAVGSLLNERVRGAIRGPSGDGSHLTSSSSRPEWACQTANLVAVGRWSQGRLSAKRGINLWCTNARDEGRVVRVAWENTRVTIQKCACVRETESAQAVDCTPTHGRGEHGAQPL